MHYSRAIKTISFTESLISEYRDLVTNAKLIADNKRIHTLTHSDSDKIFDIVYHSTLWNCEWQKRRANIWRIA